MSDSSAAQLSLRTCSTGCGGSVLRKAVSARPPQVNPVAAQNLSQVVPAELRLEFIQTVRLPRIETLQVRYKSLDPGKNPDPGTSCGSDDAFHAGERNVFVVKGADGNQQRVQAVLFESAQDPGGRIRIAVPGGEIGRAHV